MLLFSAHAVLFSTDAII